MARDLRCPTPEMALDARHGVCHSRSWEVLGTEVAPQGVGLSVAGEAERSLRRINSDVQAVEVGVDPAVITPCYVLRAPRLLVRQCLDGGLILDGVVKAL
jgi:hypothetical protein